MHKSRGKNANISSISFLLTASYGLASTPHNHCRPHKGISFLPQIPCLKSKEAMETYRN